MNLYNWKTGHNKCAFVVPKIVKWKPTDSMIRYLIMSGIILWNTQNMVQKWVSILEIIDSGNKKNLTTVVFRQTMLLFLAYLSSKLSLKQEIMSLTWSTISNKWLRDLVLDTVKFEKQITHYLLNTEKYVW